MFWLHLFDNYGPIIAQCLARSTLCTLLTFLSLLIFINMDPDTKSPAPQWVERCLRSRNPNHIVNSGELSASACPPPPWWNEAKYSILVRENIQISSVLRNGAVCYCAVGVVTDLTTRGEQIEIIYLVICGFTVSFYLPNLYIFYLLQKWDYEQKAWLKFPFAF